jgi:hypothetical protein
LRRLVRSIQVPPTLKSALTAPLRRRLREIWRSAGWPCRDNLELELLAAGLLERRWDADQRETLHLTDAGVQALADGLTRHRAAHAAHEALVERVAREQQRAGRIVWRGLALRAPLPGEGGATRWAIAMPDVYSIRHTTREDFVEPIAHEIKVSRADLLSDLRRPDKAASYAALASQCWYVIRRGIGQPEEIPPAYGVLLADDQGLEVARPAPARALRLPLAVWMALARAAALPAGDDDAQAWLGAD